MDSIVKSLNKDKVVSMFNDAVMSYRDGNASALEVMAYLEVFRFHADNFIQQIKEYALEEAENLQEKDYKVLGGVVKVTPSRKNHEYQICPIMDSLNKEIKELQNKVDSIKKLAKESNEQGREFSLYADPDTGEVCEVPASVIKYTKASVKIDFK